MLILAKIALFMLVAIYYASSALVFVSMALLATAMAENILDYEADHYGIEGNWNFASKIVVGICLVLGMAASAYCFREATEFAMTIYDMNKVVVDVSIVIFFIVASFMTVYEYTLLETKAIENYKFWERKKEFEPFWDLYFEGEINAPAKQIKIETQA